MSRGLLAAITVTALATGGVAVADRLGAETAPGAQPVALPLTAVAETPVCPGPETLQAPEGAAAVAAPGRVVVAAVAVPPTAAGTGTGGPRSGGPALAVALGSLATGSGPGPSATTGTGPPGGAAVTAAAPTRAGPLRTYTPEGDPVPAVAAAQGTLARDGDLRGLATVSCPVAGTDLWLVGGGTRPGRRGRLLLSNPSGAPAVVDLTVHGPYGPVQPPAGTGVVVPPLGQKALFVDALAPGLTATAVRVQARSGRVAAVLHDSLLRGTTPGGTDDIAPAAEPARRQYIPGIAVSAGRTGSAPTDSTAAGATAVRVVAPEADDAVVRVHLLGPAGELELPGGGVTTVAARSLTDIPLVGVPDGTYTAVVDSDTPVVSGAVVGRVATPTERKADTTTGRNGTSPTRGSTDTGRNGASTTEKEQDGGWTEQDGAPEFGWAAATRTLTTVTALAVPDLGASGTGRDGVRVRLALAGTGADGRVGVAWVGRDGEVGTARTVRVPAGYTVTVGVPPTAAGLVLQPDRSGGDILGALVITAGDIAGELVSIEPVRPGVVAGRVAPEVLADPRVGLPATADPLAAG